MEATNNPKAHASRFSYQQLDWGDLIYGSKEQLQELGIGGGVPFPGEPGGNCRKTSLTHPLGYALQVFRDHEPGCFSVCVRFPNWPQEPYPDAEVFAAGVIKRCHVWGDEFLGTVEDLAAASLLKVEQLPGCPGMRKGRVTVLPDGTVLEGPTKRRDQWLKLPPGTRSIERASASTFRIHVSIEPGEVHRRDMTEGLAYKAWCLKVRALPRPAPLSPMGAEAWQRYGAAAHRISLDTPFHAFLAKTLDGEGDCNEAP